MIAFLFSWANVPYTMALLVVALYVALQVVGLLPWSEGADAPDADGAHELGVGAGHGIDADGDADADADGDADGDHDHDAGMKWLGAIGVGKVPTTVVWQTLLTMFGLAGLVATSVAAGLSGSSSGLLLVVTFPAAAIVGFVLTGATVRVVARVVPSTSGKASSRLDLVGCLGIVISRKVTTDFGEVRLTDKGGRVIRVVCYVEAGRPEPAEGAEVLVSDWDRERDRLYVTAVGNLLQGGDP